MNYEVTKQSLDLLMNWRSTCPSHIASSDTIFIQITMDAPPRVPRVSKNCNLFLQINLLSFWAKVEPKLKKLRRTIKTEKKIIKNACSLTVFQIFFNLGSILAHQISMSLFSGWWRFFWHPWSLWGLVHIEDIMVLLFVFKFFTITFFKYSK